MNIVIYEVRRSRDQSVNYVINKLTSQNIIKGTNVSHALITFIRLRTTVHIHRLLLLKHPEIKIESLHSIP